MKATCPRCKTDIELANDQAETGVQCPECRHSFRAPKLPPPTPRTVIEPRKETEEERKAREHAAAFAKWDAFVKAEAKREKSCGPQLAVVAVVALFASSWVHYSTGPTIMLIYLAYQLRSIACDLRTLNVQYRRDPPPDPPGA